MTERSEVLASMEQVIAALDGLGEHIPATYVQHAVDLVIGRGSSAISLPAFGSSGRTQLRSQEGGITIEAP